MADDEYVLKDGAKNARVHPTQGVKQGCPLSPLLFSLYISDVDLIAEDVRGAVTGIEDVCVTHMLLNVYARKKHLIINTVKSEIVHFNSAGNNLPVSTIGRFIVLCVSIHWQIGLMLPSGLQRRMLFQLAGKEFSSALQTLHLDFLKDTLGVKQTTTNWAVLRECGTNHCAVRSGGAISMNDFSADLRCRLQGAWIKVESVDPGKNNNKLASYQA
eukprot:1141943-Pelagomonas_calceolata.AAC.1